MQAAADGANTASFVYNGLGDRVSETGNGVTTSFVNDLAAGLTQVLDDGSNTYLYGNGRIVQRSTLQSNYFLTDALGSVRQLVDETGAVTLMKDYEPYGVSITGMITGSTASTNYGFTGEWEDELTGLLYLRARYYDSYLNQFIQPDTILPDPRVPQDWNSYLYARNNPINFIDPRGTTPYNWTLATFTDERTNPTQNLWSFQDMLRIASDLWDVAHAYADAYNDEVVRQYYQDPCSWPRINPGLLMLTPEEAFFKIHKGPLTIARIGSESGSYGQAHSDNKIEIFTSTTPEQLSSHPRFIVHEVGHAFENAMADTTGRKPGTYNGAPIIRQHKWGREGLSAGLYNNRGNNVNDFGGFYGAFMDWQFSRDTGVNYQATPPYDGRGEIFADMFVGWVYGKWEEDRSTHLLTPLGQERKDYMDLQMSAWIYGIIQVRIGKIAVPYIEHGRIVYRYQNY